MSDLAIRRRIFAHEWALRYLGIYVDRNPELRDDPGFRSVARWHLAERRRLRRG